MILKVLYLKERLTHFNFRKKVTTAKILPQINFSIHQWKLSQNLIVEDIITKVGKISYKKLGESEDKVDQSLAGEFLSIINVLTQNQK